MVAVSRPVTAVRRALHGTLRRARRRGSDAGSTLVAAVMVCAVAVALGVVVVGQAVVASRDSGRDRQRTAQVHAAEAGVDGAYHQLQSGTTPCGPVTTTAGTSPDTTTVTTTVTYVGAAGTVLACPLAAAPVKALITATSTSMNSVGAGAATQRTMESQVLLGPKASGKGYAIFSNGTFTVPNAFDLSGNGVDSPDIYARRGFTCANGAETDGNVFAALGGAQLSNSCRIAGDLRVRDAVTLSNTASVGGDASSSSGGLTLHNAARVGGDVAVRGAFAGPRSQVAGRVTTGAAVPDPLDQPLPYIGYDEQAWRTAGFAVDDRGTDCESIKARMVAATTPTLFRGACRLSYWGNNRDLRLKTDVALFLTGGMDIAQNFELASDTGAPRRLWIVSPAGTGARPASWNPDTCTGGDVTFSNQTEIDPSVSTFVYSCGRIAVANNASFAGQLYGRQVDVSNRFRMSFVGLPPVGVDLGGAPVTPGYRVEVVYKRETQNP